MTGSESVDGMTIISFQSGALNNYTYIVACEKTHKALVIDPTGKIDAIYQEAVNRGLTIRFIVNTHSHWDHTDGNSSLQSLTGADIVMHRLAAKRLKHADRTVEDGDRIQVGEIEFTFFHTPGHTPGGICLYARGQLFTGDTLFVGDSGRTDLEGSDRPTLGASIRRLMQLPGDTIVRPGHNIGPKPTSTLNWEKRNNVNAVEYGYYDASAGED